MGEPPNSQPVFTGKRGEPIWKQRRKLARVPNLKQVREIKCVVSFELNGNSFYELSEVISCSSLPGQNLHIEMKLLGVHQIEQGSVKTKEEKGPMERGQEISESNTPSCLSILENNNRENYEKLEILSWPMPPFKSWEKLISHKNVVRQQLRPNFMPWYKKKKKKKKTEKQKNTTNNESMSEKCAYISDKLVQNELLDIKKLYKIWKSNIRI